ncbi:TRAP transporter substrate-binding protein [Oceanobacillus salinisoli]|uniref:TRAP transporter substrate-binding protein n=1 Tax=Oceanobacillus salinisoli TaxID=2678611 RepID=UPI0012E32517|nr:DctP family TRAP transporter solute-binding subunit [Oceanobacillus salinisoli]
MKLNRLLFLVMLTFTMLVIAACSGEASSEGGNDENGESSGDGEFVIKAGHAASQDHFQHATFEKFKEVVEENSDGRIKVEIYPNSQLGGEREMIEAIQLGNLTMAAPSSAPLASFSEAMLLWDLPYLFPDAETAHRILDGEVGQTVLDSLEENGLKGLVYWENGFRHFTNNVRPVSSTDDLKGIKMRTLENPLQVEAWSSAGVNATPIAFNELYSSLQQGTVDAQETPLALMYSMKFYEVQDYLTLTGHMYSPWPVIISPAFYDSLPDDLQQVVFDAAVESQEYNRQLSAEDEENSLQLLEDEGMEVIELTEEQRDEFKSKMEVVYEDIANQAGQDLFEQLMDELE